MTDRSGIDTRTGWAVARRAMEGTARKHTPRGVRRRRHWPLFEAVIAGFGVTLRGIGLYRRGVRNALDIELNEIELRFPHLPAPFDGYRVLHLADLHLDAHPALPKRAAALARRARCDLCVLTGDYRYRVNCPIEGAMAAIARLAPTLDAADGIYAILGNHDTVAMVPALEAVGIRVLTNQTVSVTRDGAVLHLTGIDDVHYFYTADAAEALGRAPDGFRLALVHSPEMIEPAAEAGIDGLWFYRGIPGGIGGALYVPQVGIINPSEFAPAASIEAVIWVAVGGRGTLSGAILGAVLVNLGKTWFTSALPELWLFGLGGLFIFVTLFLPKGIVGLVAWRPRAGGPPAPAPGGGARRPGAATANAGRGPAEHCYRRS